ncbi:MAG: transcriptional activator RfaH [bacterium ADurb.Bin478]|nr:MAG: transcriptional activator RfaH [bacterium ADurb.Bin478]
MSLEQEPLWYAFVTRPRHEKKVKQYLDLSGIESFLPMQRSLHQWKDRRRWVEAPLFSCYIFSRIAYARRFDVLRAPSVARIVSFNNKPTPVHEQEIDAVRRVLAAPQKLQVVDGIPPGSRVRITSGPLAGLEGVLAEHRGSSYFMIHIEAIGKSILIDASENTLLDLDHPK